MLDVSGSSGLVTSLAVISFCIASVLMLASVISNVLSSSFHHTEQIDLKNQLDSLLEAVAGAVTELSFDGYRYLRPDWEANMNKLNLSGHCSKCDFAMITIRSFGHEDQNYVLKDMVVNLEIELEDSLPFFVDILGIKRPGEIVATVGT